MNLEAEHEELLARIVEASRDVPREDQWFMTELMGGAKLQGPGGPHDVIADDVYYLRDAGLLRGIDSDRGWLTFRVSPARVTYDARMKQRDGEPLERQEADATVDFQTIKEFDLIPANDNRAHSVACPTG